MHDPNRLLPTLLVLGAILFNLWILRAERLPTQSFNDAAVHVSMIRWAAERIGAGELPFDGWVPSMGLGWPQFHHYQSLPHVIAGVAALALGAAAAYSWSLYLLLALWPLGVFAGARLIGWDVWQAAFSALLSGLVVSEPSLGYELGSYVWLGSGVWTQLWAMWLLPLSWGFAARAISGRQPGFYLAAAVTTALTVALHLMTGYLALVSLGVMVLAKPSELGRRTGRAALVAAGSVAVASWVIVPLIADSGWANQTRYAGTIPGDSYGARRIVGWLLSGELFDAGRLPVITLLLIGGALLLAVRFREEERARTVLGLGALSLVLYFGRPTLGALVELLPGGGDLIFRRFIVGLHMAGILIAGYGAAAAAGVLKDFVSRLAAEQAGSKEAPTRRAVTAACLAVVVLLSPAIAERAAYSASGRGWIVRQVQQDAGDGAAFDALVEAAQRRGPGRIYAGTIWGDAWGDEYRIGAVPAYASLLYRTDRSLGFVLRTQSLSSDVETEFDEFNRAHYRLFNVRYLILPSDRPPPVEAHLLLRRGRHRLWEVGRWGYLQVVDTVPGTIEGDRSSLGEATESFMRSEMIARAQHPYVRFDSSQVPEPTAAAGAALAGRPGSVEREATDLDDGQVAGTVYANRNAVVMLKTTFHPRWTAEVDGRAAEPVMIAPSFLGVQVPRGRHDVEFAYQPVNYWWWLAVGLAAAGVLGAIDLRQRKSAGSADGRSGSRAESAGSEPGRREL